MIATDIDTLIARADCLCRAIAPKDLGTEPLYIIPQSRLPEDEGGKSVCHGYTSGSIDLCYQHLIGDAWRGRGACMVVNDLDFDQLDAIDIEQAFFGTVLHEFAHVMQRPILFSPFTPTEPEAIKANLHEVAEAVASDPPAYKSVIPFAGHGARFIRVALHLQYRAGRLGVTVGPGLTCAGQNYGLSHANAYRRALGSEPRRLADESFREILTRPFPRTFSRLWAADVVHWFTFHAPYGERLFT